MPGWPIGPPVLLITDRRQAWLPLAAIVEAAFAAGCRWLSVRERDLPPAEQIALAHQLRAIAAPYRGFVMLHGDPALAADAGLGGVHLAAGCDVAEARRQIGAPAWLSVSCHDLAGIHAAAGGGADAVTLSPIFMTASKPGYGPALGMDGLRAAAERSPLPIIALAGIDATTAAPCLAAGAAAVAVMGGIMRAREPFRAMAALLAEVGQAASARPRGSQISSCTPSSTT